MNGWDPLWWALGAWGALAAAAASLFYGASILASRDPYRDGPPAHDD